MKTGALVLGIIGGLIALIYGFVGYGLGSLGSAAEAEGAGLVKLLSIALPVVALIGAGIIKAKPAIGAALMAIGAIGFVLILGFNFFSLIPVVLLGLGALLGLLCMQEDAKQSTTST